MTPDWGDIPTSIEQALRDYGPMTACELANVVPVDVDTLSKTLRRMRDPSRRRIPLGERRVHVIEWTHDAEGRRSFPRPIYQLGHGENRPAPAPKTRASIVAQQRRRKVGKTRMNFVFNLGAQA
jgi:hypothetical protein